MRIMLWTGLRMSECLSLRQADLRLTQDPAHPQPEARRTGQQGETGSRGTGARPPGGVADGLEVVPRRERNRPLFGISRLWVSKSMKGAAAQSFMAFSSSVNLWAKSVCRQSSGGWSNAKLDCLLSLTVSSA